MKAGLFGGGWEDYLDALNEAFDRHVAENAPPHPFGASVDAIMTGYPDAPRSGDNSQGGAIGAAASSAPPAPWPADQAPPEGANSVLGRVINGGSNVGDGAPLTGGITDGADQIAGGERGFGMEGRGGAKARYLVQPEYDEFASPKGSLSFTDGGPSQLGYGGLDDADGGAGYPNLKQDRNGNAIAKVAAAADIGNSGDSDQLTAFRSLMANPTVEGRRNDVYPDSLKIPTVGIGHKVVPSDNLRVGDIISDDRVNQLFAQDGSKALNAAKAQAAQAGISDPEFIAHLASVNFQLGTNWASQFGATWGKIVAGDYAGAADGLNKTLWARQTPVRVQQFQSALLALPPKASH